MDTINQRNLEIFANRILMSRYIFHQIFQCETAVVVAQGLLHPLLPAEHEDIVIM